MVVSGAHYVQYARRTCKLLFFMGVPWREDQQETARRAGNIFTTALFTSRITPADVEREPQTWSVSRHPEQHIHVLLHVFHMDVLFGMS